MARLLHTYDPFTWYSNYKKLTDKYTGSDYDGYSTSYNITLSNTPLCFFIDRNLVTELTIKDSTWPFSVTVADNDSNFYCTTTPRSKQTTELIVKNGEEEGIYLAPDSLITSMYWLDSLWYDPNTQVVIDNDAVGDFCSVMWHTQPWTINTGSVEYLQYELNKQQYEQSINYPTTMTTTDRTDEMVYRWLLTTATTIIAWLSIIFISVLAKKLLNQRTN